MYVRVDVTPAAKRERFAAVSSSEFMLSVKEPAERNLANRRVVELIAQHFRVHPKAVHIISGHHTRRKMLSVHDGAIS